MNVQTRMMTRLAVLALVLAIPAVAAADVDLVTLPTREGVQLIAQGAKVDARANNGQTPLHKAANGGDRKDDRPGPGHLAAAKVLLKHGADPHAKDNSGRSPLDLASTEEMKALLKR